MRAFWSLLFALSVQPLFWGPPAATLLQWRPTNATGQNGYFSCRSQMQTNVNDPDRRDDTVGCGWNVLGEIPAANVSSLTFEAYYVTNAGARQSETYFGLSDGHGHSHRPYAMYYDIDANIDQQIFTGDGFTFSNQAGSTNWGSFSANGFIADYGVFGRIAEGDVRLGTNGPESQVGLVLSPKGNGRINLQTSAIDVSKPLCTNSARDLASCTGVTVTCAGGAKITEITNGLITAASCP